MSFDWNKLIDVANHLHSEPTLNPEARCRSVINRAYYCAYHLAVEYAEGHLGFQATQTGPDHTRILDFFRQRQSSNPQRITLIVANLERLKKQRIDADYRKDIPVNNRKAEAALRLAQSIIQAISSP